HLVELDVDEGVARRRGAVAVGASAVRAGGRRGGVIALAGRGVVGLRVGEAARVGLVGDADLAAAGDRRGLALEVVAFPRVGDRAGRREGVGLAVEARGAGAA